MKFLFTLAGLVFSAAVGVAQTPSSVTSLIENPVYQKNCAKCHGKTAEGRHFAGPSLVSEKATGASGDELRDIITNGRHRMPKFVNKLTPEEINTLVEEIKAQKKD
jgi:mono/diheme cytochrome c family protein